MSAAYTIALVGNPNCGKTTLFNALTGSKQQVGNWPGVTVERKVGYYRHADGQVEVVDLPGTYSLDVTDHAISLDEKIVRDFVHASEADLVVNIIDASNLERNLYLTSQLVESGTPLVVALNMMDVAAERGMKVDVAQLAATLGCPVVPLVAAAGQGVTDLKQLLQQAAARPPHPTAEIRYDNELERAIASLSPPLEAVAKSHKTPLRWLIVRLLEGDDLALRLATEALGSRRDDILQPLHEALGEDIDIIVADGRYGFANRVAQTVVQRQGEMGRDLTDRIDRVVLNRLFGIPIFLFAMYLMFMLTIHIGGAFIDFFDMFAGALFVDGLGALLTAAGAPEWLTLLLADGIGGGIQVVATFIPVIGFLYLFLSALEDSGYMARAAFVMDRFMRWVGLPGKSFVPLIVGFGCNVPAIMATRTLEHQRDRIMTVVMAPFMSCGARLPVYALFAAAFFPVGGQNVVFGLYLIGIAVAILTGLLLKHTLLQGEATPFVMELPPYHLPTWKGVSLRTWDRLKGFIVRAGRVIVPMVLVLNVLNAVGTDGSFGNEESDNSILSELGRDLAPLFSPMGLNEENWPATVGIFTGVLAKEAVVGTLDAMYTALAEGDAAAAGEATEEAPFNLTASIGAAFATIPANLTDAVATWADPLGLSVGEIESVDGAAAEQGVATGTFGAMVARFDGAAGAFAYLLFILLYAPCVAAIAAVYRETSAGWTLFVAGWTTGVGYATATLFYQVATFARHPQASMGWIAGIVLVLLGLFVGLRWWVRRRVGLLGEPLPSCAQ